MDTSQPLGHATVASPIDDLHLVFAGETLLHLDFAGNDGRMTRSLGRRFPSLSRTERQAPAPVVRALDAYFAGDFERAGELAWMTGGTVFQRRIWRALGALRVGETVAYGGLAERLGLPRGASRAIGAAVGANPISIFVPCHRVVGADGRLTGYAGGLDRKRWLLRHESVPV